MAPRRIIIDTDPGIDDVLAILLACSALPEEVEILLISVTYGNIDVQKCLHNVVSLFHSVEKEIAWRTRQGRSEGFETLRKHKPLVAVGPEQPLADQVMMADYFHGKDGLAGIHDSHPHLSPEDTWDQIAAEAQSSNDSAASIISDELIGKSRLFVPSKIPAHLEILRVLRENEPDSITIVAVGPLTNLALAAAEDPETFLRSKEVVVMGGAIHKNGNITPQAEFNTFADSIAAARVYALTSRNPHTTMPPSPPSNMNATEPPPPHLAPYPSKLSRQLKLTLFPLDVTENHCLTRGEYRKTIEPLLAVKSPLAEWTTAFLNSTFDKIETLQKDVKGDAVGIQLHDPLCVWYCIAADQPGWKINEKEDIRVETSGQWTRGACVIDQRRRKMREDSDIGEIAGDTGNWLSPLAGNRLRRCVGTPGEAIFGTYLLKRIFAL